MWIMLNDAFLSIVSKDCARDELLVRARRRGDIDKIFPGVKVVRSTNTDYLFRAIVKRSAVTEALAGEVGRITYSNFKDSVTDDALHGAYNGVWARMSTLQPSRPYGVKGGGFFDYTDGLGDYGAKLPFKTPKKKPAKRSRKGQ